MDKADIVSRICDALKRDDIEQARSVLVTQYPFNPIEKSSRQYTPLEMTRIFLRDGFIDRYKGNKLVFPPALRLISHYFPDVFPYHKNGKMTEGHIAYWELFPTIDHVVPVARGGQDSPDNWICCSMLTNSIKSNWTLEELGWELLPPGKPEKWDGMLGWFVSQITRMPSVLVAPYFKRWHNAAVSAKA
jgi:hypothetical protein